MQSSLASSHAALGSSFTFGASIENTHTHFSPKKIRTVVHCERLDERTSPTGLTGIRRREVIRIVRVAGRCRAPACGCCPSSTNTQRSRRGRHHPRPGIYKAVVRSDPKSSAPGTPRKIKSAYKINQGGTRGPRGRIDPFGHLHRSLRRIPSNASRRDLVQERGLRHLPGTRLP